MESTEFKYLSKYVSFGFEVVCKKVAKDSKKLQVGSITL